MSVQISDKTLAATPALYVVATPLGHVGDISQRALEVLRQVDLVAAEDTRHTQRLFDAYGINTKLLAVHEHNEQEGATRLIELLGQGLHVALVTDAGTPAISDPGARVVRRVQEAGFRVVPLPGPSAVITALSAAGLVDAHFHFHGFLPTRHAARVAALDSLRGIPATLVFYEAPHRILECVDDIVATLEPAREIVIARELTKLFEQIVRLPLAEAPAWLRADANHQRGEFVLCVSAAPQGEGLPAEAERVLRLLLEELPLKSAAKLAAEISGASKNALYERALELKRET